MSTYSRAPFISYDGKDENGLRAEVKVVVGYGDIFYVEDSDNGKAAKVTFKVENSKWKSSGWAPLDSNVIEKVKEAQSSGVPIHFRIETRRKDHVDRSMPMAEVSPPRDSTAARDNTVKSLAAVRLESEENWVISPHAKTRLEEDPKSGGGSPSAYDTPLEELKPKPSSPHASAPSHSGVEAPPFTTYNNDGSLNLGSVAVSVPSNLFSYVTEYERTHKIEFNDKQRIILSKLMLSASNEIQLGIYDGEKLTKPDLSLGSHTRARALLFESIRTYFPITLELVESKEEMMTWRKNLVEKSLWLWRWSISEVNKLSEG